MRHTQGCILHISRLLTEDSTQETLFRCEFLFAFWCDLADQDIIRTDFGTDTNNTVLVQILYRIFPNIGNVARYFFRSQLCIAGFHFILLDMNGGKAVFLDKAL